MSNQRDTEPLPSGEQYATGAHGEQEGRSPEYDEAQAAIDAARANREDFVFTDPPGAELAEAQTSFAQAGDRLFMGVPGLTDTGTMQAVADEVRERCAVCGGIIPNDHDLLAEVLGWLGTDGGAELVRRFYIRLFEVAPDLRPLFPDDITIQEEKLLSGIVSLLQLFRAGDDQMETLNSALAKFGRSHTRFDPAATIEEYAAVKGVLFEVAAGMLTDRLTPQHVAALTRAYEYAAGMMLAAQATATMTGKGRRRRTV